MICSNNKQLRVCNESNDSDDNNTYVIQFLQSSPMILIVADAIAMLTLALVIVVSIGSVQFTLVPFKPIVTRSISNLDIRGDIP